MSALLYHKNKMSLKSFSTKKVKSKHEKMEGKKLGSTKDEIQLKKTKQKVHTTTNIMSTSEHAVNTSKSSLLLPKKKKSNTALAPRTIKSALDHPTSEFGKTKGE